MNVKRELTEIRTSRDSTTDFMSAKQKHLIGGRSKLNFHVQKAASRLPVRPHVEGRGIPLTCEFNDLTEN